eukprot:1142445-Pelagomonas_calceolata.AAC.1
MSEKRQGHGVQVMLWVGKASPSKHSGIDMQCLGQQQNLHAAAKASFMHACIAECTPCKQLGSPQQPMLPSLGNELPYRVYLLPSLGNELPYSVYLLPLGNELPCSVYLLPLGNQHQAMHQRLPYPHTRAGCRSCSTLHQQTFMLSPLNPQCTQSHC